MIVLDTNVVSELMRRDPAEEVDAWVHRQESDTLHLTAITVAELVYGALRLPAGRRQRTLAGLVEAMVEEDFDGRVLAFDHQAARHYAAIVVRRERAGPPIAAADAQIAAICRSHSATLATRNVADFTGIDVEVIDPWDAL
jgi:predicted nucleic acid-binding protein